MKTRIKNRALMAVSGLMATCAAIGAVMLMPTLTASAEEEQEGKVLYYVDAGNLVANADGTGSNTDRGAQGYSNRQDTVFMQKYGLTFAQGQAGSLYNSATDTPYGMDLATGKNWGFSTSNSGVSYSWDNWRYGRTSSANADQSGYQSYRQVNEGAPMEGVLTYTFEVDDATTELDITFGARVAPGWGQKNSTYSVNGSELTEYEANDSEDLEYTIENVTGVAGTDGKYYITLEFGHDEVNAFVSWILITTDDYELVETTFVNYSFTQFVTKGDETVTAYHPGDGEDLEVPIPAEALEAIDAAALMDTVEFAVMIGDYAYDLAVAVLPASTQYFVDVGLSTAADGSPLPDVAYSAETGYGYTGVRGTEAFPGSYDYSIVYGGNNNPFEYTFDVPAGDYAVVVGTYGHWSMGRTMNVLLNGSEVGELTAVADTATNGTYYTTVSDDGSIELEVAFGNDNYIVSYVLVYAANSIRYDACGGTSVDPIYFEIGETGTFLERETQREGYIFDGWYTEAEGGVEVIAGMRYTESVVVYAHWSEASEDVVLTLLEGEIDDLPAFISLVYGSAVEGLPESAAERTGYSFGWYTKASGGNRIENGDIWNETVTELFGRYEANEYEVTLDAGEGTLAQESTKVTYDAPVGLPVPTAPAGSYFVGWYTAETNGTLVADGSAWMIASDTTLYARYETAVDVTVTLNADGGTVEEGTLPASVMFTQGAPVAGLPILVKEGCTFAGWYTAESGGTQYENGDVWNEGAVVTALYARFTPNTYIINYIVNGGSPIAQSSYVYGTGLSGLPVPTKTGGVFAGWYLDAALTQAVAQISATQYGNVTLYAGWDTAVCTVTFDTVGGSAVDSVEISFGSTITRPADPTRNGYVFAGWYSDSDYQYAYDFAATVTQDLMVYAKWTVGTYLVTYDANGGAAVGASSYTYGTGIEELPVTVRDGYDFAGWYTNAELTGEAVTSISAEQYGDLTLYASWTPRIYTVTFKSLGGSEVSSVSVNSGAAVTQPAAPTRDGYIFTGWYYDEACTQAYDFANTVTGNLTLYAGWQAEAAEEEGGCGSTIAAVPFTLVGGAVILATVLLVIKRKNNCR